MEVDPLKATASGLCSLMYELVGMPIVKLEEPKRIYFQLGQTNTPGNLIFLHMQEHIFIVCYTGELKSAKSLSYPMQSRIIYQRVLDPIFESSVHKIACCMYMAKVLNEFKAEYMANYFYTQPDTSMLIIPTIHTLSSKLISVMLNFYLGYEVLHSENAHFVVNNNIHVILDRESLAYYTNPLEHSSVTYPNNLRLDVEQYSVTSVNEYGSRAVDAFIAFLANFIRSQQQVMNTEPQMCPPPIRAEDVVLKASVGIDAFELASCSGNKTTNTEDAEFTAVLGLTYDRTHIPDDVTEPLIHNTGDDVLKESDTTLLLPQEPSSNCIEATSSNVPVVSTFVVSSTIAHTLRIPLFFL